MRMYKYIAFFLCSTFLLFSCFEEKALECDVLVLGVGTGATSAAIQSARSGAKTILIHPQLWLGGMLTSAGVSAIDGNHKLPAGMWAEFRQQLRDHYGGEEALFTGWVSNTMFEPKVGAQIWESMAKKEDSLSIYKAAYWKRIKEEEGEWIVSVAIFGNPIKKIKAKVLIDGTDLGDVAAAVGASYDLGMDAATETGESMAPQEANDIVQDMTWVAILKDYGEGADKTIPQPDNYNPADFYCSCKPEKPVPEIPVDLDCGGLTVHPCETMLTYGLLPNKKYMINWPLSGNDAYLNVSEMSEEERRKEYKKAIDHTLGFVYYIQTVLGYKNLGLAEDEFPSEDLLAFMPYHREGRRIKGLVQVNVNHILEPYASNLYKTGIAVGDYPIDHHHYKNEASPEIDFPPVPSFNIPMGALIPKEVDNLIIADKPISVTNIVNGSSRLQPVIIQIGQVAGLMGAMAARDNKKPANLSVRAVQEALLKENGYLMPFIDVPPDHPYFEACQKVGAAGILKGRGVPYQWANQTWFDVDTTMIYKDFIGAIQPKATFRDKTEKELEAKLDLWTAFESFKLWSQDPSINGRSFNLSEEEVKKISETLGLKEYDRNRALTKGEIAVLINYFLDPFGKQEIDISGNPI